MVDFLDVFCRVDCYPEFYLSEFYLLIKQHHFLLRIYIFSYYINLVFMLRHKILKSKFNRPAKLSMSLGVS